MTILELERVPSPHPRSCRGVGLQASRADMLLVFQVLWVRLVGEHVGR